MITLNLNTPAFDLKGKNQGQTLGEILANLLVSETKGSAIKYYKWALALSDAKVIMVDSADFKTIYDLVENTDRLMALGKAQILLSLDEQKDAANKPKDSSPEDQDKSIGVESK